MDNKLSMKELPFNALFPDRIYIDDAENVVRKQTITSENTVHHSVLTLNPLPNGLSYDSILSDYCRRNKPTIIYDGILTKIFRKGLRLEDIKAESTLRFGDLLFVNFEGTTLYYNENHYAISGNFKVYQIKKFVF